MSDLRGRRKTTRASAWRLAWFAAALLWLGGLTFYSAVVVPIGADVTDSTTQGFVTRRVVWWLNAGAGLYLAASSDDLRRGADEFSRRLWIVLAVCLVALVLLHGRLDELLDPLDQSVRDSTAFYARHRIYLLLTTAQWAVGVWHAVRRMLDRERPSNVR